MPPEHANARAGDPGAADAIGKISTAEDSATTANGQEAVARIRCPGCARKCRKLVPVHGWAAGRETLICQRCAAGLILDRGHVTGLKLRPEARP